MGKRIPVVAVFDIGKTNKKLLVFDEDYKVVKEDVTCFPEVNDDDGFPCENLDALSTWILSWFVQLKQSAELQLKAVNFSTYGASLVYVNAEGKRVGYLYNYLKPYPEGLMEQLLVARGGPAAFGQDTSSPLMGHLNAGFQLYWLKHKKPDLYDQVTTAFHFPQYLSFLITGQKKAEMTSLGCHSAMWDFSKNDYHHWLKEEGILPKLATVTKGSDAVSCKNEFTGEDIQIGTGLHDSSAAVIPYLSRFTEPFTILSTGTWVISMNPFNQELPASNELEKGCLSYLTYQGTPMKTTMLFAGNDHDQQVKRIAEHFAIDANAVKTMVYDAAIADELVNRKHGKMVKDDNIKELENATTPCIFHLRDMSSFNSPEQAYHQLILDMIAQQEASTAMVLNNSSIKHIYVDGGFCKNKIYMQLLANTFSTKKIFATSMTQGTALGAALALHAAWNGNGLPESLISLKPWMPLHDTLVSSEKSTPL